MRYSLPLALILVLLAGCSGAPDYGTKPFQGRWVVVESGASKKKGEKEVVFENDTVTLATVHEQSDTRVEIVGNSQSSGKHTFTVDASKNPGHIDVFLLDGPLAGKSRPGIFAFEGDRLKIALAEVDKDRPADFVAAPKTTLMILERRPPANEK